jgi:prophage DNA circulation protein
VNRGPAPGTAAYALTASRAVQASLASAREEGRREGHREAAAAIEFDVSCVNCAKLLGALYLKDMAAEEEAIRAGIHRARLAIIEDLDTHQPDVRAVLEVLVDKLARLAATHGR